MSRIAVSFVACLVPFFVAFPVLAAGQLWQPSTFKTPSGGTYYEYTGSTGTSGAGYYCDPSAACDSQYVTANIPPPANPSGGGLFEEFGVSAPPGASAASSSTSPQGLWAVFSGPFGETVKAVILICGMVVVTALSWSIVTVIRRGVWAASPEGKKARLRQRAEDDLKAERAARRAELREQRIERRMAELAEQDAEESGRKWWRIGSWFEDEGEDAAEHKKGNW